MKNNEIVPDNSNHFANSSSNGMCSYLSISQCVSSSTLQIVSTTAVDSGEYTCVANNVAGSDAGTAQLIVNGKLFIKSSNSGTVVPHVCYQ